MQYHQLILSHHYIFSHLALIPFFFWPHLQYHHNISHFFISPTHYVHCFCHQFFQHFVFIVTNFWTINYITQNSVHFIKKWCGQMTIKSPIFLYFTQTGGTQCKMSQSFETNNDQQQATTLEEARRRRMCEDNNEADIFTKNTTKTIFQNHQKKLVWDKGEVNKEGSQELTQKEILQEGC